MQPTFICFFALIAYVSAQVYLLPGYEKKDEEFYRRMNMALARGSMGRTWETNAGRGKVFGTLGSTDTSIFGRAGYKQDIFNDHRGHLEGQGYGSRVLGATGDSSVFGGKLNWSNDNARATADVHKEVGGASGMTVTGDGVWKLDKNTRLVAGGNVEKNFGHDKPVVGLEAKIEHDF
ncbi:gloverin-like [Helicoverpa armigera]|uniref:gloverin-like n=1 Tax=Helicoverpa armigera TaxID=29058 RepID=UPI003083C5DD